MSGASETKVEGKPVATIIEVVCLVLIATCAFSIRLFSIVKYESVIHEFDPYFNYRVTQLASEKGESSENLAPLSTCLIFLSPPDPTFARLPILQGSTPSGIFSTPGHGTLWAAWLVARSTLGSLSQRRGCTGLYRVSSSCTQ